MLRGEVAPPAAVLLVEVEEAAAECFSGKKLFPGKKLPGESGKKLPGESGKKKKNFPGNQGCALSPPPLGVGDAVDVF